MALTATANARVRTDILANLHMEKSLVLTQSFNRPNLKYEVRPKGKNVVQDIADFIKAGHAGECGIIYCNSRVKCEEVAADLCEKHKIQARHFHAVRPRRLTSHILLDAHISSAQLLDEQEKSRIQTGWQAGAFQVICATIAYVDFDCVATVLILTRPTNLIVLVWVLTRLMCATSSTTRFLAPSRAITRSGQLLPRNCDVKSLTDTSCTHF